MNDIGNTVRNGGQGAGRGGVPGAPADDDDWHAEMFYLIKSDCICGGKKYTNAGFGDEGLPDSLWPLLVWADCFVSDKLSFFIWDGC